MKSKSDGKANIGKLETLMERLRAEDGCPWDRAQSMDSLVPFIIEEAYEVICAIDSGKPDEVRDELGDLMFQVIFVSQMAKEKFHARGRHRRLALEDGKPPPHVFGRPGPKTPEEVLRQWAEIKKKERERTTCKRPEACQESEVLPALLRAHKDKQKAAKASFDWKNTEEGAGKTRRGRKKFKRR
ncbi:MAG: hypothetical protein HS130_06710 [Deltaproteobacteria bacterium]|nr:hypothetical protein [Deltaproteobacteria bacterium]